MAIAARSASTTTGRLSAIGLVLLAVIAHHGVASKRSMGLLDHDEAISLIHAAGAAERAEALYDRLGEVRLIPAAELQALLRPGPATAASDVFASLAVGDFHPPLCFLSLYVAQRLGCESLTGMRMIGTLWLLLAAWAADQWIWRDSPRWARLLAAAWILMAPTALSSATELRQYALVNLGVALSLAALFGLRDGRASGRCVIGLLVLAPIVLLWSHFGSLPWCVAFAVLAVWIAWRESGQTRRRLAWAACIALACLTPLAVWRLSGAPLRPPQPIGLGGAGTLVLPILGGLGRALFWAPGRWHSPELWAIVGAAVFGLTLLIAGKRRDRMERWLWVAAAAWITSWVVLIGMGRIPQHAITAKYLAAPAWVMIALLTRATESTGSPPAVKGATACLVLIGALSGIGLIQSVRSPAADSEMRSALNQASCMIVDQPKRGYLMPLVAIMDHAAEVIVCEPAAGLAEWERLSGLLPDDRLLFVQIDPGQKPERAEAGRRLIERLGEMYERMSAVHSGPSRVVTEFRRRRANQES